MSYLLFDLVAQELEDIVNISSKELVGKLEIPPDTKMGDVSFPCFALAKSLRKPPAIIAHDIKGKMTSKKLDVFSQIETVGGYLNFYLNRQHVYKCTCEKIIDGSLVDRSEFIDKKVTIEHTSVNPNASPHIGRARNAMIGDAISRLCKYLGCQVTVHYFVNDIGKQIALLACYTKNKPNVTFNELLNLYVAANEDLKSDKTLEDKVFDMLNRMENGDKEDFEDFSRIVDICIKGQAAIFNEFGIYYDQFDYESQYVKTHRTDEVLGMLEKTGRLFEDDDGRMVLDLGEYKINSENPYLPLTRKDKTSLYPLRDICYSIYKSMIKSSRNIVVLGEDQRLYGRQINAALSLLGYVGAEIVNYSFVLLPDGKMSTRAGQVVLLEDLMRDTVAFAKTTIAEHHKLDVAEQNGMLLDESPAKSLAYGAIKYSILKCSNDKNVVFDRDNALNFQGDTSVYIQYSFARIQSLMKDEEIKNRESCLLYLDHDLEWELTKKILSFTQVLSGIAADFNFASLCSYLYELCQIFSRWYKECNIKNAKNDLKNARLYLAYMVSIVLRDGLYILGIDAPERI